MSGKPRVYGEVANFGRTFRGGFWVPDDSDPQGRGIVREKDGTWPADIRDSRAWYAAGAEAALNVYWDLLKKVGLNTFSEAARPSHQEGGRGPGRGQRNRQEVRVIQRWKVGVYLAFEERRMPDSVGPWWTGGRYVLMRLVALPAGRRRVETAAALCAFLGLAMPSAERGDLCDQAHDFLRGFR